MLALIASLLLAAAPGAPRTLDVLPGSTLTYRLVHRFHSVTGVSRKVEGKARLLPDGTVQVMVRAPLDSFDSGNANRDEHMLEATDAGAHPYVSFKGIGKVDSPERLPPELKLPLRGELTLKTARPVEVTVEVRAQPSGRALATCTFPVSLDAHGVERPSLMFVKVEDQVRIEARLELAPEP